MYLWGETSQIMRTRFKPSTFEYKEFYNMTWPFQLSVLASGTKPDLTAWFTATRCPLKPKTFIARHCRALQCDLKRTDMTQPSGGPDVLRTLMGGSDLQHRYRTHSQRITHVALPVETALSAELTFQAKSYLTPFLCKPISPSRKRLNLNHMQCFYENIAGKRNVWTLRS